MKILLITLLLLLAIPIAFTGASLAIEFTLKGQGVACFARCADGVVTTGVGLMWK